MWRKINQNKEQIVMAKCDICHKAEAVMDFTITLEGKEVVLRVCELCAKQEKSILTSKAGGEAMKWLIGEVVKQLEQAVGNILLSPKSATDEPVVNKQCPECGITFEEIKKTSKLGCPNDYEVFKEELTPVVRIIQHMASQHTGKKPSRIPTQQQVKILEQQLSEAVDKELYEEAAVLRDKINNLKGKV